MRKVTSPLLNYLCLASITLFSSANGRCQTLNWSVNVPIYVGTYNPPQERNHFVPVTLPQDSDSNSNQPLWRNFSFASAASPLPNICVPGSGVSGNINVELSCEGMNQSEANYPVPDTNAAVGYNEVVEFINDSYLILDKSGNELQVPTPARTLFPQGVACSAGGGDIIVKWDQLNQRWLLSWHLVNQGPPERLICLAVSEGTDAAGSYYVYEYDMSKTSVGEDYPKWGIWPTGYFQTVNGITAGVCAYDSSNLIQGRPALQICVAPNGQSQQYEDDYTLLPGDVDSKVPPPRGQDEFFIGSMGQGMGSAGQACNTGELNACTTLYVYSMHPNFANPTGGSTFTGAY